MSNQISQSEVSTIDASAQLSPQNAAVRQQIIEAADKRIRQYGYAKTTMTEIATDCSMSAANLYRYFKNKADLVSILAQGCMQKRLLHIDAVFADESLSVTQRIEKWIVETAEWTYGEWAEIPHVSSMINDVCKSNPDLVRQQHAQIRARVLSLVASAVARKEIGGLEDAEQADLANAIVTATAMFSVPYFMHIGDIDTHRRSARRVARLINRSLVA